MLEFVDPKNPCLVGPTSTAKSWYWNDPCRAILEPFVYEPLRTNFPWSGMHPDVRKYEVKAIMNDDLDVECLEKWGWSLYKRVMSGGAIPLATGENRSLEQKVSPLVISLLSIYAVNLLVSLHVFEFIQ
jgi:hypothetical protein